MQVIKGDRVAYFDVDDTLVMWGYGPEDLGTIPLECQGHYVYCKPHAKHIEAMKRHAARGHTIVVWSAGGVEWATTVVEKLGLSNIVDAVACKPSWWYDDLKAEEILRPMDRIYYNDEDTRT